MKPRSRTGGVTRRTIPLVLVLVELSRAPGEVCGVDVAASTGLPCGTVYPLLGRLAVDGLVKERKQGNRVFLILTEAGHAEAAAAVRWAANERTATHRRRQQLDDILRRAARP